MANVSFPPMNFGVDMKNPSVYNVTGQMNTVIPPWLPQNTQPAQYEPRMMQPMTPPLPFNPQMGQNQMVAPQIAYVPVFVDAQGRPFMQNFLPTVGLNQFMQAPSVNFSPSPTCGSPTTLSPTQRSNSACSSSNSDSGSSCRSVSPEMKPQISRRSPPSFKIEEFGQETWADVSERKMAADARRLNTEVSKRAKKEPNSNRHKKKRFGYRSKQNKIDTVYETLVAKYTEIGTLFDQDDVLRGPSVIRLHVKKYDALCSIEDALQSVESCPGMEIDGVSIPLSMKNTFQKKGFLVYFRLTDVSMVGKAQEILRTFPEFKKCDVANSPEAAQAVASTPTAL